MFKETVDAIKAGVSAYELTAKSLPVLRKLVQRITKQEMAIAVFGCGGTGKTTFGRILSGESDPLVLAPYKESYHLEQFQVDRGVPVSIIVPPGQDRDRRADQRKDVLEQILVGKVRIIVNAVAYGYHSFGAVNYTENPLHQTGMPIEQFLGIYTAERRQEEIEQLKKIEMTVQLSKSFPTLMMTLITKQDLWWPQRNLVKEHYLKSTYNDVIEGILRARGNQNFSHEYVSASLVTNNFESDGEPLASVASGYDQKLQIANLPDLTESPVPSGRGWTGTPNADSA